MKRDAARTGLTAGLDADHEGASGQEMRPGSRPQVNVSLGYTIADAPSKQVHPPDHLGAARSKHAH